MSTEPEPPWLLCPQAIPGDYYWREAGESYWHSIWTPFWQSLDAEARTAYLARPDIPKDWREYLTHFEAWSAELNRIDADDIAAGILRPDGTPWPEKRPRTDKRLRFWYWVIGFCFVALLASFLASKWG